MAGNVEGILQGVKQEFESHTKRLEKSIGDIGIKVEGLGREVSGLSATVKAHTDEPSVHTRPPCDYVKTVSMRLWAFVAAALTTFIALFLRNK